MMLPGVCIICRAPVVWAAGRWRTPRRTHGGMRVHRCALLGPRCGRMMSRCGEPCARPRGHLGEHRTEYALGNARYAATGRRQMAHTATVGVSDTPTYETGWPPLTPGVAGPSRPTRGVRA